MTDPSLSVTLSGVTLKNPVMPASGTFGYGHEMARVYDLNVLGALCLKGTTKEARFGNELPRVAECHSGMLNAVGLQNPGVDAVIGEILPRLRKHYKGPVLANISGFSVEDYAYVAERFDQSDVSILEINISCPNVKDGGVVFGRSEEAAAAVTAAVRRVTQKPIYLKLSPNVTDILPIAKACESEGADGLVLINTLFGMRIEPRTGKPILAEKRGGLSGRAIKPIAVYLVHQTASVVKIPIIGVGGISSADDVIEMLSAGASAVQIGSENIVNPYACKEIIEELPHTLLRYRLASVQDAMNRSLL